MSVKIDPDGRRWVQVATEVPGTPEQVWQAIATGPGVSSWFVPTEKQADGTIVSHFGPGFDVVAKETAYEPLKRFVGEADMAPGVTMATEWSMEARDGGTCVVRVVHSLFADTDDWDGQLESVEGGWPVYFGILRLYLTHFAGWPGSPLQFMAMVPGTAADVWEQATRALGLEGAAVGEHRETAAGAPRLAGFVESTGPAHHPGLLVRLDEPSPGLAHLFPMAMGGMVLVMLRLYLYGEEAPAAAAQEEPVWQAWLGGLFPSPQ